MAIPITSREAETGWLGLMSGRMRMFVIRTDEVRPLLGVTVIDLPDNDYQ